MAKKKNELSYGQVPLPEGRKYSQSVKWAWNGLNRRNTIDSGDLSVAMNMSTADYPRLVPSARWETCGYGVSGKSRLFGFDDFLVCARASSSGVYVTIIKGDKKYTSKLRSVKEVFELPETNIDWECYYTIDDDSDEKQKFYLYRNEWKEIDPCECIVQFNLYDSVDPLVGTFKKKLLIFPDKKVMDFDIKEDNFPIKDLEDIVVNYSNDVAPYLPPDSAKSTGYFYKNTSEKAAESADTEYGNAIYKWVDDDDDGVSEWKITIPATMPNITYATVYLSRVFGVDDERIYASGYNNYANWTLDTAEGYNESNAWVSVAQANTKAGGDFTGITSYQGHIVCFKKDYMHELYNNKNPFRVQDIYAEGCIDNRSIQEVDGSLIFASADEIKVYTGGNPRVISYPLNLSGITYAVSGTDSRNYYLYCEDADEVGRIYVYDTYTEMWTERSATYGRVYSFASNKVGMYALAGNIDGSEIYKVDSNNVGSWHFETDLLAYKTVNIKRIKKLQMFTEVDENARFKVYILYDGEEYDSTNPSKHHLVFDSNGRSGRVIARVKPKKSASYGARVCFVGSGYVKFYDLELFTETGGDLYATN